MKPCIGKVVSFVTLLGMMVPAQAFDQLSTGSKKPIPDVSLTVDGEFLGVVIRRDGRPIAGQTVRILHNRQVIAVAKTDANGRYKVKGLRAGSHKVSVQGREQLCRVWESKTAPPTSKRGLASVEDTGVVRAQNNEFLEIGGPELMTLAAFGGVTAVTLASTVGRDDDSDVVVPASP